MNQNMERAIKCVTSPEQARFSVSACPPGPCKRYCPLVRSYAKLFEVDEECLCQNSQAYMRVVGA